MIYREVSVSDFRQEFRSCGRDNFSYEGYEVLYDYLDDVGGEEGYELDVVALDCEYTEYSIEEALEAYNVRNLDCLELKVFVLRVGEDRVIVGE